MSTLFKPVFTAIILLPLVFSCDANRQGIFDIEVESMDEVVMTLDSLRNNELSVIYFLSPECPLCQNYTVTMKKFRKRYSGNDVKFYGIFPGREYSPREIRKYLIRFELEFPAFIDSDFALTEFLGATITPEVFVLSRQGTVLYQGAFDNWAIDLGTKRNNITEYYLRDALDNALAGTGIEPAKTEAVGCFIQ